MGCTEMRDSAGKRIGWVCGGRGRKAQYYFGTKGDTVWLQDSLWYDPIEIARRNPYERRKTFRARVKKKLGFVPLEYKRWSRWVLKPWIERELDTASNRGSVKSDKDE